MKNLLIVKITTLFKCQRSNFQRLFLIAVLSFIYLSVSAQSPVIIWQKSIGGSMFDYGYTIKQTSDGGFITVGYTESNDGDLASNNGGGDCWIVKQGVLGTIEWQKVFGGTGYDYGYSIQQTSDGGYVLTGYTESNNGNVSVSSGGGDCWVIKLDDSGNIQWEKTFGGTGLDNGQSIQQTSDGGYIVTGYTESTGGLLTANLGGGDCWIFKLDAGGELLWEKRLGGNLNDYGQFIRQTADGGFIITGGTESNSITGNNNGGDCWVIKLDHTGDIQWQQTYGGSMYDYGQSVDETNDGGYVVIGYSESNNGDLTAAHGNGDCWVLKISSEGILQWQKSLGGSENDYGYSILQTANGGYVLTGYTASSNGDATNNAGSYDCWVVRLNNSGAVEWQKTFGGSGTDIGYCIEESATGGYIISGFSDSNDGDVTGNHNGGDLWVISLNELSVGTESYVIPSRVITVSPNPSNGLFQLSGLSEGSEINIVDISGKQVLNQTSENSVCSFDLSEKNKGIYFVTILDAGKYNSETMRIIIQ